MIPPDLIRSTKKIRRDSASQRDRVLAFVSHELRTPVTAILGWTELMQQQPFDEKILARGLEVIERNAHLQARLIEQLLNFSRVNNGGSKRKAQETSLKIVLEDAVDTMMPVARAKEIDLRLSLETVGLTVAGDPIALQQVVTNLLANAIRFTPAAGRIDVGLARYGSWALVTVSDNGAGIPPETLPYIFDPFRRSDADLTSRHNGLGLGLTIARQIVKEHYGEITATSSGQRKGTTFTIRLPIPALRLRRLTNPLSNNEQVG